MKENISVETKRLFIGKNGFNMAMPSPILMVHPKGPLNFLLENVTCTDQVFSI